MNIFLDFQRTTLYNINHDSMGRMVFVFEDGLKKILKDQIPNSFLHVTPI